MIKADLTLTKTLDVQRERIMNRRKPEHQTEVIYFNPETIDIHEELTQLGINVSLFENHRNYAHIEVGEIEGEGQAVYAYEHGSIAVSLSPFSCQWDSGCAGIMSGDRRYFRSAIRILNLYLNNDNFYFFDEEAGMIFEGSQEECIEWANVNGYRASFNY